MLEHQLLKDEAILIVSPKGPLKSQDFTELVTIVDPFIKSHGNLKGILIYSETFPGWENFGALINHLKFVKDHHQQVKKVAAVTDDKLLSILPKIITHFVHAEVKQYKYNEKDDALDWLKQP